MRERVASGEVVKESSLIDGSEAGWRDEKYLIPFMENDRLLFELDEALGLDMDAANPGEPSDDHPAGAAQLKSLSDENEELRRTVQELRESLKVAGSFIEQDASPTDKESATKLKNVKIDKNYFDSYAGFGIHREMLSDRPRMVAYRTAIEWNAPTLVEGKEVLDVGCGTGILSMIAARAGARHVCAVDGSANIAATAQEIVAENDLGNSIDVKSGLIEEEGTIEKGYQCDVIVSEWMGYCLLYESMLFSVLHARDKYLKEGGCVLPDLAQIFVAGCDESAINLNFWDDVEGFSMKSVGKKLLEREMKSQAHVRDVDGGWVATSTALVSEFDLCTMAPEDAKSFSSEFDLTLEGATEGAIHALVIWFDNVFSKKHCPKEVVLTTSPKKEHTHWAQTLLVLPQPIDLDSSRSLKGKLTFEQHTEDYRGLHIVLEYGLAKAQDGTYPHAAQFELV